MSSARYRTKWLRIGALALAALLVVLTPIGTSRESQNPVFATGGSAAEVSNAAASRQAARAPAVPPAIELNLDKLRRTPTDQTVKDAFGFRTRFELPPLVVTAAVERTLPIEPPPPPEAPPLPFRYLGKMIEDGKLRVFIATDEREHTISGGETLDDNYRVEDVSDSRVTFIYLPLGTTQVLSVNPHN